MRASSAARSYAPAVPMPVYRPRRPFTDTRAGRKRELDHALKAAAAGATIIDVATDVRSVLPQLVRMGVQEIIRYLTRSGGSKLVSADEAAAIGAAGLKLVLVFEEWGGSSNFIHGDISAADGTAHALWCVNYLRNVLRAPPGVAVYFAIDNDVQPAQLGYVLPYFASIHVVFAPTPWRDGIYAPGFACAAVLAAGTAQLAWLPNATGWDGFSAFYASNAWALLQQHEQNNWNNTGLSVDTDVANPAIPDHGAWVPFAATQPPLPAPVPAPVVHDAAYVRRVLIALGATIPSTGAFDNTLLFAIAQEAVLRLGFDPKGIDGQPGANTLAAMTNFIVSVAPKSMKRRRKTSARRKLTRVHIQGMNAKAFIRALEKSRPALRTMMIGKLR